MGRLKAMLVPTDDYWFHWVDDDGAAHCRRPHVCAWLFGHPGSGSTSAVAPRVVPPGMTVAQTCDNPRCVNPAHLSLVPGEMEGY